MIYFREVKEPTFNASETRAKAWHVECYDATKMGGIAFPVGMAFVIEVLEAGAQLNFIFIADQWRRRGFGKELAEAIKARWPNCTATGPMDHRGAALLRSAGIPHDDECDDG